MTFYSSLYAAEKCDTDCAEQLIQDLPQIDSDSKTALDIELISSRTHYCSWSAWHWTISWYRWVDV